MEDILVFTDTIKDWQKNLLLDFFCKNTSLPARLVVLLLKGERDGKKIISQLKISTSTFNKILSQARHELLNELGKITSSPYDEIYILKTLIFRGHFSQATRYFNQLEKHFEQKQMWQHLELLFVEGSRLCQATGNIKLSAVLSEKRTYNSKRLKDFIDLSTLLNALFLRLEVYESKQEKSNFQKEFPVLQKKANQAGHHTLIQNALQLQYLFYSRYTNDFNKAEELATRIFSENKKYAERLNNITRVIGLNVYVNYTSIYKGELPKKLVSDVSRMIGEGGEYARFNFYYALIDYYLFENKIKEVESLLKFLEEKEDSSKFTVYREGILALKFFSEGNIISFRKHLAKFLENPEHLVFPEVECFLRIVEAIHFIQKKENEIAHHKLNSLRVFIGRNLSGRYIYEKNVVAFLNSRASKSV